MRCVVFLAAHADDMELGAGGACALLCSKGYDVRVVIATDEADATIAKQRRLEAIAGAMTLGVKRNHVYFLGQIDGFVTCNRQSVTALRTLVAGFGVKPVAVFTHTEADSHQDHIATSKLARAAFREVALFKFLIRNSAVLSSFAPSVHCMIDSVMAQKEASLLLHVSQGHANRIPMDKVRAFARKFARGKRGTHCEPFELEVQNEASSFADILQILDGTPFTRLWSPLMGMAPLTVLASHRSAVPITSSSMSELMLLTRLQGRLMRTIDAKLGLAPADLIDIRHSVGAGDEAWAERGHVLVVGTPDDNPAAERLFDWIGLSKDGRKYNRTELSPRFADAGLLTIAANPFAQRAGRRAFIIGATGPDQASSIGAAMALLDDAKIVGILDRAGDVLSGRTPAVHIKIGSKPVSREKSQSHAASARSNVVRLITKKA